MSTAPVTSPLRRRSTFSRDPAFVRDRLLALDIFRGLTIATMILVNNPGAGNAVYAPLRHAHWNGWTMADLIFPFFLFVLGISVVFSTAARLHHGQSRRAILTHALWRSLILVALGLVLNGVFYLPWDQVRIPGVLQRIGIVYFLASLVSLGAGWRRRIVWCALLLLGYWAALLYLPLLSHQPGDLTPYGNLASRIDRHVFGEHMWRTTGDPEGLLSTVPALATALLGTLAGDWLRSGRERRRIALGLLGAGAAATGIGWIWGLVFPINKHLWSSSYALFATGLGTILLGLCYWATEIRQLCAWGRPFLFLGVNPLALYAASEIVGMGATPGLQQWLVQRAAQAGVSPPAASLLWAMLFAGAWWVVAWALYRNTIFIKL